MKVYIVVTPEPDAGVHEVWASSEDAQRRALELHARWPGMGYHVVDHEVRSTFRGRINAAHAEFSSRAQSVPGLMTFTVLEKR